MPTQRNAYKGSPVRPWIHVSLTAADGVTRELDLLADTGNPCPVIVAMELLHRFNSGFTEGVRSNFGELVGGWLRIQVAELQFDETLLGFGSDAVFDAVRASHVDFQGLAGLPLLRMMQYGGDNLHFWVSSKDQRAV